MSNVKIKSEKQALNSFTAQTNSSPILNYQSMRAPLTTINTCPDGNSAIHAMLGEFNQKDNIVFCSDETEKRFFVAEKIEGCDINSLLFSLLPVLNLYLLDSKMRDFNAKINGEFERLYFKNAKK